MTSLTPDLTAVRIVLVRTHYAGNIGSVARLMANFGLRDLVLVDPIASLVDHDARRLATNGVTILDSARVVNTMQEALADCVVTLATGGLTDGVKRKSVVGTPREKLPFLVESLAEGPVALVFGPEPHGLTTEEIGLCHGMIHIPVGPEFPSLNLAQSAAICLYELFQLGVPAERLRKQNLATHEELDRMLTHLRDSFEKIHYVYGQKGDQLMHGFRHVILRARPTKQEVRMLHGLARQLLYLAGHPSSGPADDDGE